LCASSCVCDAGAADCCSHWQARRMLLEDAAATKALLRDRDTQRRRSPRLSPRAADRGARLGVASRTPSPRSPRAALTHRMPTDALVYSRD
jgi:hypothetical protein